MEIKTIIEILDANCLCGEERLQERLQYAFSSDLMSDVLTLDHDTMVLITGLCNLQTIRTAEMADIRCIIFVRDKRPSQEMVSLARENGMVLLRTAHSMYQTSGLLFTNGLKSVF